MLISQEILKTVGFLDPAFRASGWGSDADYCHRVWMPGLELYVSYRAILWH
jgi:GT2 family glycosyltransferase